MKTTVWTLACSDDSAPRAFVFTSAEDAATELIEQALSKSPADRTAAEDALKRGDIDAVKEIAYSYISNNTNRAYVLEEHEIETETEQERITRENIEAVTETFTDEQLLELAQGAQTIFWDAVRDLEQAVGFDIDSSHDLSLYDLDNLEEIEEQ